MPALAQDPEVARYGLTRARFDALVDTGEPEGEPDALLEGCAGDHRPDPGHRPMSRR